MVTHLAPVQREEKEEWRLATAMVCHGCDWLLRTLPLGDIHFACVYNICMLATIVYIYLCCSVGIFLCEAHFNMLVAAASVWRVVWWFTCFTLRKSFHTEWRDDECLSRCFRVRGQCSSLNAGHETGLGVLFNDLRTVAPGFSLSFGQSQPGWLRGHLWRVAGGEAL